MAKRKKKKGPRTPHSLGVGSAAGVPATEGGPDLCPRCGQAAPDAEAAGARVCAACEAVLHAACWEPGCAACAAEAGRGGTKIVASPPAAAGEGPTSTITAGTITATIDAAAGETAGGPAGETTGEMAGGPAGETTGGAAGDVAQASAAAGAAAVGAGGANGLGAPGAPNGLMGALAVGAEAAGAANSAPIGAPIGTPVGPGPEALSAPRAPETGTWAWLQGWVSGLREEFSSTGAALFLLAVIGLAAYANCFQVPFLFDDAPVVTRNRLLWQWSTWWELFWWNPTRGLTNLTFLANFKLAGTSTVQPYDWTDWWSFHLVSLSIHVANGFLVFRLVRDLLRARPGEVPGGLVHWVALLGAAVWVVHPANTMAVTYIAQRYALLAATAFLGTLVLYVRLRGRIEREGGFALGRDWPALLGLGGAALCCLFTKENAWVVPGAVVLVEALFFRARFLWGLVGVGAIVVFVGIPLRLDMVGGEWAHFFPASSPASDRWQYATTQVVVTLRYLHLWLMPHDLTVEQSFPFEWATKGQDMALAGVGHLLLLTLAALLLARGLRFVPFAIFWYYLTNVVESSFIPILDPMVDHRMYLTTAMLAAAIAVSAARSWPWVVARLPRAREAVPLGCMALVALMVVGTLVRNTVWTSSTGIWVDTIEKRPDCARAYSSLGMEHLYAGEWLEAVQPIETALQLGPYHVEGWNNLGKTYLELEQWDKAAAALERGIEVNEVAPSPSIPLCWNNLGLVFFNVALRQQDDAERRSFLELAVPRLAEAARLDPAYEVAWINLGNANFQLMSLTEGEKAVQHALACVDAIQNAEAVALRRGGALPLTSYRYRSLALAQAGRPLDAFPTAARLAELYGAETPALVDDLGRLAVDAVDLRLAAAAASPAAPAPLPTGPAGDDPAGLPPEVIKALETAGKAMDALLARDPTRVSTRVLRSRVSERLGDRAGAVALLRRGLAAAPAGSPDATSLEAALRKLGEMP